MAVPILATKLYIPSQRPKAVLRPHLIERLNRALDHESGLSLISAPAGFGKTTLVSEWLTNSGQPAAWLSLDEGDNDPTRFLAYLIAALQTLTPTIGVAVLRMLQSPQPPQLESLLTPLLNEITTIPDGFILVLDDYHAIDSKDVNQALSFLLDHQPPQMHLVITTREDPSLPLARLRARGQLTELRAADLRFTPSQAAEFLNQVMGLHLSAEDIAALEARTEGWIAGLQLAALSMQAQQDKTRFIQSFTGSHHFIMDYLVEEVLHQQPETIQTFLLQTSILNRMSGPLCDAILPNPSVTGQTTLEFLEHANLFIVPLDNERRWYRYHHLFADLLRQRLYQNILSSTHDAENRVNELHIRASQWYEENGLEIEAFHHAVAAKEVERAERLSAGRGIPLHLRGATTAILNWLSSLPVTVLKARPWLWLRHASLLLITGQTTGVEEKLQAAEAALGAGAQDAEPDEKTRNFMGQIAASRSVLALTRYDVQGMLRQSQRALEYLHPANTTSRSTAHWTLGFAHLLLGDRVAAQETFTEAVRISQSSGDTFTLILATIGLGILQEAENQLHEAAETYRYVLELAGDQPLQIINEAHLGLARVLYEWNDLNAAQQYGDQALHLARQYEKIIDRFIICEIFLARLKLTQGDIAGAEAMLSRAEQSARERNFVFRIPDVAAVQVLTLLRQNHLADAAKLAQAHNLRFSQARVHLAEGDTTTALAVLEQLREQAEVKNWQDERLKVMILQSIALHAHGEQNKALEVLGNALTLAEPGGFIRLFIDEGSPMAALLSEAAAKGIMPHYVSQLLTAFEAEHPKAGDKSFPSARSSLIELLSPRELEVLRLIAQGLSNQEISQQIFLALDTVKGHNRRIYDKLQVQRRTEAVARARELGLL